MGLTYIVSATLLSFATMTMTTVAAAKKNAARSSAATTAVSTDPSNGPGAIVGVMASLSIVLLWLITFHKKFFISLIKSHKENAYGVYTDITEALQSHVWFLIKGLFITPDRDALEVQVKREFLRQFLSSNNESYTGDINVEEHQVLLTHSCRSIFYYIIKNCLDQALEKTGESKIKIALPAVHFGSFYRLLRGMEKSMKCKIEFYEIDLNEDDWTLNQNDIDEEEFKKCNLVVCQHLFGYPYTQDKLLALGKKYNIPIMEDCVQSGSLFSKYKGNALSDVVMYSGGLDKTPQCFGAGMGYFRDTPHGNDLYRKCKAFHDSCAIDTWKARMVSCFNQVLHLFIAKDAVGFNNIIGLIAYVWLSERGDYVKWYAIALKVRKAKAITPFQHAESGFLKRPSPYHLQSMLYGLTSKLHQYPKIAQMELDRRDLLLSQIPTKYHRTLFPWWTAEILQLHKDNMGISEFSWVVCPKGGRMELCQFLNDNFLISMINTTWEFHEFSTKSPVGKDVNNRLVYLPNLNQVAQHQVIYIGKVLTKYAQFLEQKEEGGSTNLKSKQA